MYTSIGTHPFWLRASRREFEMQIQKPEWKLASKMGTIVLCCLSLLIPLFPNLFIYFFSSSSELTGVWGTNSHQRRMLYTTRWSPLIKGRFSPAWRAPAVWLHFHRATAPLPLLKRASSKYIQHFSFRLFPLDLYSYSYMVRNFSSVNFQSSFHYFCVLWSNVSLCKVFSFHLHLLFSCLQK